VQIATYAFSHLSTCSILFSLKTKVTPALIRDVLWYRALVLRAAGLYTGATPRLYNVFEQFFKGGLLS
jgi:hypothetical protein